MYVRTYWIAQEGNDDLDTMNHSDDLLDSDAINADEEGFIRGFNAAA